MNNEKYGFFVDVLKCGWVIIVGGGIGGVAVVVVL